MSIFSLNKLLAKGEECSLKLRKLTKDCIDLIYPDITFYVSVFRISKSGFILFDSDIFEQSAFANSTYVSEARGIITDEEPIGLLGMLASGCYDIKKYLTKACIEMSVDKHHYIPFVTHNNKGCNGIIVSFGRHDDSDMSSILRLEIVLSSLQNMYSRLEIEFSQGLVRSTYFFNKSIDIHNIVEESCKYFLHEKCITRSHGASYTTLYNVLSELSTLTYEKKGHASSIVFLKNDNSVEYDFVFENAHNIHDLRKTRKLLELTGEDRCLACYDYESYGLSKNVNKINTAIVSFNGQYSWDLTVFNVPILSFRYGKLGISQKDRGQIVFESIMRTLPSINSGSIEKIEKIVMDCLSGGIGTILVFSNIAEDEAERLKLEGIRPRKFELDPRQACYLAKIDGAILIDFDLVCHGFGVILDGTAVSAGNAGRGARYNSACRYYEKVKSKSDTIIFVLSDDGTLDIMPSYEPLISRLFLEDLIDKFKNISFGSSHVLPVAYRHLFNELKKYEKYLTENMCNNINAVIRLANEKSKTFSLLHLTDSEFTHGDADDSWFKEHWYDA